MNKLFFSIEAILIAVRDFEISHNVRGKISFNKYYSLNWLSNV